MTSPETPTPWADFLNGVVLAVVMQVLMAPLAFISLLVTSSISPLSMGMGYLLPIFAWGAAQMLYVAPVIVYARAKGHIAYASGLCAGAILVCIFHWIHLISQTYVPWE